MLNILYKFIKKNQLLNRKTNRKIQRRYFNLDEILTWLDLNDLIKI